MTDREVMKMALERLTMWREDFPDTAVIEDRWAVEALRQALAQPEQESCGSYQSQRREMNLLPCPVCNSPVKIDSTGASEMYGHAWQTLYVTCTQTNDEHCAMSLDLEADFDYINDASDALIECWNILARNKK